MSLRRSALALLFCGCAARVAVGPESNSEPAAPTATSPAATEADAGDEVSAAAAVEGAKIEAMTATLAAPPPLDVLPKNGVVGIIDRAGLVAIVDAGLGRLFQRVRVAPELAGGQFKGFRIVSIDPAWQSVPLAAGDVIVRLNGQAIERPEQAMNAFELLRMADELVVEFTRAGIPAELRFRIH